eukprot:12144-Eustigmatos_ZCMA.PRE.1
MSQSGRRADASTNAMRPTHIDYTADPYADRWYAHAVFRAFVVVIVVIIAAVLVVAATPFATFIAVASSEADLGGT